MAASREEVYERVKEVLTEQLGIDEADITEEASFQEDLDIDGPGADQLTVSGNHASRIFSISGGATVTIAGLTITDGRVVGDNGGGAILNVRSKPDPLPRLSVRE